MKYLKLWYRVTKEKYQEEYNGHKAEAGRTTRGLDPTTFYTIIILVDLIIGTLALLITLLDHNSQQDKFPR